MKKICTMLIGIMFSGIIYSQTQFYVNVTSSYGTARTGCGTTQPCPNTSFQITNLKACEDEDIDFDFIDLPSSAQTYEFTIVNRLDPTITYALGVFLTNGLAMPQNIQLPPGSYYAYGTWFDGSTVHQTNNVHLLIHSTATQAPSLSNAPFCAGEDISVVSEKRFDGYVHAPGGISDFSRITINMGDGTTYDSQNYNHIEVLNGGPGTHRWHRINISNHQYTQPGTYTITTTYSYNCGARIKISTIEIGPTPSFISDELICENNEYTFINTTNCIFSVDQGSIIWDFGDGNSSSGVDPTHTYNSDGNYIVTLSFTVDGVGYSVSNTVTVASAPSVNLGMDLSFCSNQANFFPILDGGRGERYIWSLNDEILRGETDQYLNTSRYGEYGEYCVTVINGEGCSASDCMVINEIPSLAPLNPNFSFSPVGQWCQQFLLNVNPNDNRPGVIHMYYVYTTPVHGQTVPGSSPLVGPVYPDGSGNLYNYNTNSNVVFDPDVHYYVKHGVYTSCDAWVEQIEFFTYTCAQRVNGSNQGLKEFVSSVTMGNDRINLNPVNTELEFTESLSNNKLTLYPNPTTNSINISGLKNPTTIKVLSLEGKIIIEQRLNSNDTMYRFDLESNKSGVYIVEITNENSERSFHRVIKE